MASPRTAVVRSVMAIDAVMILRRKGFTVHGMEQGVVDWRARGWRLARGAPREEASR